MADYAQRMRALGVRIIGACCGSTPEHIRSMRAALDGPPLSDYVPAFDVESLQARPGMRRREARRARREQK
jgi:5-methyltetrahydrofolate--homocysteine methyltransferase